MNWTRFAQFLVHYSYYMYSVRVHFYVINGRNIASKISPAKYRQHNIAKQNIVNLFIRSLLTLTPLIHILVLWTLLVPFLRVYEYWNWTTVFMTYELWVKSMYNKSITNLNLRSDCIHEQNVLCERKIIIYFKLVLKLINFIMLKLLQTELKTRKIRKV